MKYIYSTSQMSKLNLILYTFSITGLVAGLSLILLEFTSNILLIIKFYLNC